MTRLFATLAALSYPLIVILVALACVACAAKPQASTTVYPAEAPVTKWSERCQCEITVTITESTLTVLR